MWFAKSKYSEYFHPTDAELTVRILQEFGSSPQVAEIGVWKGAWVGTMLRNQPGCTAVGIDPYPNGELVKQQMEEHLTSIGVKDRFQLFKSFDDVPREMKFEIIHIDGLHTESQVLQDFKHSMERLADDGVIVLDDFRHLWFPGITSALFSFLYSSDFKLFMISANKAYLARKGRAQFLWNQLREDAESLNHVVLSTSWTEFNGGRYEQQTDVLGQPVLIATPAMSPRLFFRMLSKVPMYLRFLLRSRS